MFIPRGITTKVPIRSKRKKTSILGNVTLARAPARFCRFPKNPHTYHLRLFGCKSASNTHQGHIWPDLVAFKSSLAFPLLPSLLPPFPTPTHPQESSRRLPYFDVLGVGPNWESEFWYPHKRTFHIRVAPPPASSSPSLPLFPVHPLLPIRPFVLLPTFLPSPPRAIYQSPRSTSSASKTPPGGTKVPVQPLPPRLEVPKSPFNQAARPVHFLRFGP